MRLVVDAIEPVAERVVEVRLVARDRGRLPSWTPGAHIELALPGGLDRQYSLVGDPAESGVWRVAVLLETDGRGGSAFIHSTLAPGDLVTVRGPRNNFRLREARQIHFIASGIGITPILGMAAHCERVGLPWTLDYIGRRVEEMAYVDELPRPNSRVHVTSRTGRPTLSELLPPRERRGSLVYACGSVGVLAALEAALVDHAPGTLQSEAFVGRGQIRAHDAKSEFEVVFRRSGTGARVASGESIVAAAERAGVFIPTSCGLGVCGSCECPVTDGFVDHRDSVLGDAERRRGDTIMACVSGSRSNTLTLDI